jgi:hypothetical protein
MVTSSVRGQPDDGFRHEVHNLPGVDDAEVVVRNEADGSGALAGCAV